MKGPVSRLIAGIACAVLVLAGVAWLGVSQWQSREDLAVAAVGTRPPANDATTPPDVQESPGSTFSTPRPIEPSSVPVELFPVPRFVRIPGIDVASRIVPVGLEANGALGIPEDVSLVGWYRLGVPPGADQGSAVLVAHRDGRGQGRGVFYELGRLDVGDLVSVRTDAGDTVDYSVVARESIAKKRLPYEELFSVEGPPRLTLISCGGYYDPADGGYQDNIVISAVPVADS